MMDTEDIAKATEADKVMAEEQREAIRNPIITPGDPERWPLLEMESQTCSLPLSSEDEEAIALMHALLDHLDEEAAGLAAVQIGYPKRIFLLRNGTDAEGKQFNKVYVNPVILGKSKDVKSSPEACLSLPHMVVNTKRPKKLVLEFSNENGEFKNETFSGFWAKAVCHEMDHLNGVLLIAHLDKQIAKQPRRTSFGMVLTPHRLKVIAQRRAKAKRLKRARKHAKAIGR